MSEQSLSFDHLSVLVVDQNRWFRHLLRGLLGSLGVRNIQESTDGADALKRLQSFSADMVCIDSVAEPVDGLEFLRLLRTSPDSPDRLLPVIMISSQTDVQTVKLARDAGVTEFLRKPVSGQTLYARLYNVVMKPRPYIQAPHYFGPDRRRRAQPLTGPAERRHTAPTQINPPDLRDRVRVTGPGGVKRI